MKDIKKPLQPHYNELAIEPIDILIADLTPDEFKGYCKGNILKYILRADHKGGLTDYEKASVYIQWLIESEKQRRAKPHSKGTISIRR
jgi:hypothetical protein